MNLSLVLELLWLLRPNQLELLSLLRPNLGEEFRERDDNFALLKILSITSSVFKLSLIYNNINSTFLMINVNYSLILLSSAVNGTTSQLLYCP
jgi:hypothetical protein